MIFTPIQSHIIPTQLDDALLLSQLHAKIFSQPWDHQTFQTLLKKSTTHGFLIYRLKSKKSLAVGFIILQYVSPEVEILSFGILPQEKKQGFGWQLLNHSLQQLRQKGAKDFFLEVDENNKAAIQLYKKFGFCEIGRRENYYPTKQYKYNHALILRYTLDNI